MPLRAPGAVPMTATDVQDRAGRIGPSLVALVLAAILPLVVFGAGVGALFVEQTQAAVEARLTGTVRALGIAVDRVLGSQLDAMEVLATDASLDSGDVAAFQERTRRAVAAHAAWRAAALVDPNSHAILASVPAAPALAGLAEAAVQIDATASSRQPQIGGVTAIEGAAHGPGVLFLAPVVRGGSVRFVLAVIVDPSALSRVFADQHLSDSWTGAVIDRRMTLAGRSRDASRFVGRPATPTLASHIAAADTGLFTALNQEGATVYTVFDRSADTGWSVVIGVPAAEVQGPIRRVLAQLAGGGAVLGGLGLLLTGGVGRTIVRRRNAYERALQDELAERRRVEAALRESQRRLSDHARASADWFWEMDPALRFSYLSDNVEASIGVPADRLLGRTGPDVMCDAGTNDTAAIDAHHRQLLRREPFRDLEYAVTGAAGELRWVSVSGVPFDDEQGRFAGYRGIGQDVTARKNAELAAERGSRLLHEAVSCIAMGFTIYDEQDRLVTCNDAYREIYATSRDLIVPGARFEDMVRGGARRGQYPEAGADVEAWVARRVAAHRDADGRAIEQQLDDGRWLLIVENRTPSGFIVGNRIDITERKRTEAELDAHRHRLEELVARRTAQLAEARDAAEAANVAKSAFLANMSHELRTPLNGILGMAFVMRRGALEPRQAERLAKIEACGQQLLESISAVIDLSKLESGRLALESAPLDAAALVDQVVAKVAAEAAARGLALGVELRVAPLRLLGDAARLRQVMHNLVGNAVKFTERGRVDVRLAVEDAPDGGATLAFEVADTGIGIGEAERARLFRPFEQADNTVTRPYGGTGLGLAIADRLVRAMGGTIRVRSAPGEGSVFGFSTPLALAPAGAALQDDRAA